MSADNIGADLYKLHLMATRNLPDVAAQYDAAASSVEDVGHAGGVFQRAPQFGGPYGPAYQPWSELQGVVRQYLADSAGYLRDSAQSLQDAVRLLANADQDAGATYRWYLAHEND
jgi:hypothetical protein